MTIWFILTLKVGNTPSVFYSSKISSQTHHRQERQAQRQKELKDKKSQENITHSIKMRYIMEIVKIRQMLSFFVIVNSQESFVFKKHCSYISTAIQALLCYPHQTHFLMPFQVYFPAICQLWSFERVR